MWSSKQSARWNNVQFRSTLRYLHAALCSIIPVHEDPQEIATPLSHNDFAVCNEGESSQLSP
ncbi:hypothetical protein Csa_006227 [Cucumis sativus]|uniref:Uncharacterized protein n=1 Tax=Cucumis sativus TaxID=3659 RepID=A0A0A0LKG8_CUCSA|nr:hypothetical protein Csa_006227 [Cucumis sativus]